MTLDLRLDTCTDLQGITLNTNKIEGQVGDTVYLELITTPGNGYYQTVNWVMEDPDIAEITNSGDGYVNVSLKKAGSTTLTATVDAFTATVAITAAEPIVINEGHNKNHTVAPEGSLYFRFTAPKTATYVFWDGLEDSVLEAIKNAAKGGEN